VFLLNSCLGLFTAACLRRHPFLRTYGVNLPSSLTTLLPLVLGFSPHLPVSVCGTGTFYLDSGFSRQCGIICFGTNFPTRHTFETPCVLNYTAIYVAWTNASSSSLKLSSCVPTSLITIKGGTEISICYPSTTPFGLVLGPD
jgi:hypothetical protein